MSIHDDLNRVLSPFLPQLHAVYKAHVRSVVDLEDFRAKALQHLVLLVPKVKKKASEAQGPLFTTIAGLGEKARVYYNEGTGYAFPASAVIPQTAAQAVVRFSTNWPIVRCWSDQVFKPSRAISGYTEDPLPEMAAYLIRMGIKALQKPLKESPVEILKIFPNVLKLRKERAKFLILSEKMASHELSVRGTLDAAQGNPVVLTESWWPVLQAFRKERSVWSIGYIDTETPYELKQRGVLAMSDGLQFAAGFVDH